MANQIRLTQWLAALLLAVFVFGGVSGCTETPRAKVQGIQGLTMGTSFSMKWVSVSDTEVEAIRKEAGRLLSDINQKMSTYIEDSELSRLNRTPAAEPFVVSAELMQVLAEAQRISRLTDGAFDVTVGPLVNAWGFGPEGRITHAPADTQIDALKARVGYGFVQLDEPSHQVIREGDQYIDLSAIAKGYGVDALAELLEARGIENYLVEIGGELRAKGHKPDKAPWKLAIETPRAGERAVQEIISITSGAVATSGDYRNYFEENGVRFSHTIDPRTARPIRHRLASVTVIRPTCAEADALATALMVMGEEEGYNFAIEHEIDAFFLVKSGDGFETRHTPGFSQYMND